MRCDSRWPVSPQTVVRRCDFLAMRRLISTRRGRLCSGWSKTSHRASQVFDNIRILFGKADQGHEPIDVNELALGVLQALREELKDNRVTTQAELTSQLPFVMGHRGQLQEVFNQPGAQRDRSHGCRRRR